MDKGSKKKSYQHVGSETVYLTTTNYQLQFELKSHQNSSLTQCLRLPHIAIKCKDYSVYNHSSARVNVTETEMSAAGGRF